MIVICFLGSHHKSLYDNFYDVLKENKHEFITLNVNFAGLGFHSSHKGAGKLYASGGTVAPPITSVCLHAGWLMGNVKSCYLIYKVSGDQFFGWTVTGINSGTSDFSVSLLY